MTVAETVDASPRSKSPGKLEFFTAEGIDENLMSRPELRPEFDNDSSWSSIAALGKVAALKVLFRSHEPATPISLIHFTMPAGCILPAHSHNADCLYYVTRGSLVMGAHTVGVGEGFFVPSDRMYTYEAGPEGVEILEIRTSTSFDMQVSEASPSRWSLIRERAESVSIVSGS